jgi:hypothetical protein
MELVVNIWPIIDSESKLIQRFAARAYAVDTDDSAICAILKVLSNSDFILARQFPVPKRFKFVTPHGTLDGAIPVAGFNENQASIIEDALLTLETDLPPLHGIGYNSTRTPFHQRVKITFPKAPYFVVTFLLENGDGHLRIYSQT